MFTLNAALTPHLHRDPIDFRSAINGLCATVEHAMKLDPFASACFACTNKRRDRIKLRFWHKNGFWLCIKRLETERVAWPRSDGAVITLTIEGQFMIAGREEMSFAVQTVMRANCRPGFGKNAARHWLGN